MRRLILLILLLATPAEAAITFDAVSTYTANSNTIVSGSHTLGACTNPYVVVTVGTNGAVPELATSVTYGATGLTHIISQDLGDGLSRIQMWGGLPLTGAQTVSAVFADSQNSITQAIRTYCGVNQIASIGTPASALGTGETASLSVTSAIGELVIDGVQLTQVSPLTADGSQGHVTTFAEDVSNHTQGVSDEAGAATVSMDWTWTGLGSNYWGQVGVSLKPAAATVTRHKKPILIQ